jgi:hypothetical protein
MPCFRMTTPHLVRYLPGTTLVRHPRCHLRSLVSTFVSRLFRLRLSPFRLRLSSFLSSSFVFFVFVFLVSFPSSSLTSPPNNSSPKSPVQTRLRSALPHHPPPSNQLAGTPFGLVGTRHFFCFSFSKISSISFSLSSFVFSFLLRTRLLDFRIFVLLFGLVLPLLWTLGRSPFSSDSLEFLLATTLDFTRLFRDLSPFGLRFLLRLPRHSPSSLSPPESLATPVPHTHSTSSTSPPSSPPSLSSPHLAFGGTDPPRLVRYLPGISLVLVSWLSASFRLPPRSRRL